jgi:hypothetical protein
VSARFMRVFELVADRWNDEDLAAEDAHSRVDEWERLTHGITRNGDPIENARRADGLIDLFPEIAVAADYPCGCGDNGLLPEPIFNVIMHLNDSHSPRGALTILESAEPWTREQIAQWVEEVL